MGLISHYCKVLFFYTPQLAWSFSGSSLTRYLKLHGTLWFFLLSRKTFLRGVPKTFIFTYKDKTFPLQLESAIDIAGLAEVFVLKEYEWKVSFEVESVLDLGAHWGDSSMYYALTYPAASIYAVEPAEDSFLRLQQTSKQFANIIPIKGALSDKEEIKDFFLSENTLGNSSTDRFASGESVSVQGYSFQALCTKTNEPMFDIVKFDIEGGEECIFNNPAIKKMARAFIGEIHLDLMDVSLEEIKEYFSDFVLTLVKINDNRYIVKAVSYEYK